MTEHSHGETPMPGPEMFGMGQVENHMGQDMYQSQVKVNMAHAAVEEATAIHTKSQADMTDMQASLMMYGAAGLTIVGTIYSIPVLIFLFRWALTTNV